MKIEVRKKGKVSIVDVTGRMSLGEGDSALRDRVKELLGAGDTLILLNLLHVPHMDSASIGEVVACHKRAAEKGGTVKVVIQGKVHETFNMARLYRVFDIFADVESALADFVK